MTTNRLCLSQLKLINFATFRDEEIHFQKGFNAIIGETGSGKSLVLDALQLAFGARADKKSIRKGAEFAVVEATFTELDAEVIHYLDSIGHPSDSNEIVLKRIIYAAGTSKSFLNFQQCSLQTLAEFSRRFTDLVGQFENQKLLSDSYQLKLLDNYAGLLGEAGKYQEVYQQLLDTRSQIHLLEESLHDLEQKKDYLSFQIKELAELNPCEEEENELLGMKEHYIIKQNHAETLASALNNLSDSEDVNILMLTKRVLKDLEKIPGAHIQSVISKIEEGCALLQEASFELQRSTESFDTELDIDSIMEKLDLYQRLKRKFKLETQDLSMLHQKFASELSTLEESNQKLIDLRKSALVLEQLLFKSAQRLHASRIIAAKSLSNKLTQSVRALMMKGASLRFDLEEQDTLGRNGVTKVTFVAETNPGEGYFRVKEIASGGELSRILLSLRQILSSNDTVSVFLFDEIDTGVGGETASAIGKALQKVADKSQVIAITHLPQIAHCADCLLIVKKESILENNKERTISSTELLNLALKDKYIQDMASLH
jgi:DNA repair protein RecN (Recombination protein N)